MLDDSIEIARQSTLQFDQRFMPRDTGAIIHDPAEAFVELVANAWDAFATDSHISRCILRRLPHRSARY